MKYVALLRGVNVGGQNIIKMSELKTCFENLGFNNIVTFIQSGNVLFTTDEDDKSELVEKIEKMLSETFMYKSSVVLLSQAQLISLISEAPPHFGEDPDKYRYDVIFLKEPLSSAEAMKSVSIKNGVDEVFAGKEVLYFKRLTSKASQSKLSRIVMKPVYQSMTIRNWKTTTKLLLLLEKSETLH